MEFAFVVEAAESKEARATVRNLKDLNLTGTLDLIEDDFGLSLNPGLPAVLPGRDSHKEIACGPPGYQRPDRLRISLMYSADKTEWRIAGSESQMASQP